MLGIHSLSLLRINIEETIIKNSTIFVEHIRLCDIGGLITVQLCFTKFAETQRVEDIDSAT